MILFFYNLLLAFGLLLSAPWWIWKMATTHKYREGLAARLGRVPAGLVDGRPMIWLHAVSVGEVLAIGRLIAELDAALPDYRIVISTTTRTGQDLARKRFGADRVFYCPLDLPWAVRAYVYALEPVLLVLAETEFWPNLLVGCRKRGVPVAVVNARISDRSWPRYHALRELWAPFLERLALVLAQSELDAERLVAIGCTDDAVHVSGNLKFDIRAAGESAATAELRARAAGKRLVVCGSTLEGEEAALLAAWPELLARDANLLLVLAPRHPERFQQVADLLAGSAKLWQRRSAWTADREEIPAGAVVLLDSIGELASVYALASVAFVGGSLIPAGGHNPLEPAQFAVPVVMGPHYTNFRAIVEDMLAHNALELAPAELLAHTLGHLLTHSDEARALGERAFAVFSEQAGATARTVEGIRNVLPIRVPGSILEQFTVEDEQAVANLDRNRVSLDGTENFADALKTGFDRPGRPQSKRKG